MARLGIDAAADILERHREIARDARYHRIGIAERDHARGEMVAVLVDEALDVALEKALALEPLVEKSGIGRVALRQPRIDDFDVAAEFDAQGMRAVAHAVLAADEQGRPESLVAEGRRGADHLLFFPLREDHALRPSPQPLVDALENPGHRIAAR